MAKFVGVGEAAAGTDKTILALISAATIRPKIYDVMISCVATPSDLATLFHLERFTAVGTEGSGFTPVPVDPLTIAAVADYGVGPYSVEPTYTAGDILLKMSLNQRTQVRWVCAPGYELIAAAAANNGIGLQSQSSGGTATHQATAFHEE